MSGRWGRLLDQLRQRRVFRVTLAYVAVCWLIIQVGDIVADTFQAPAWVMQLVFLCLVIGLPLAIALAWFLQITPEGIERDSSRASNSPAEHLGAALVVRADQSSRNLRRQLKQRCREMGSGGFDLQDPHVIALFDNAHDALRCAVSIAATDHNHELQTGLSIGELMETSGTLSGDAVDYGRTMADAAPDGGIAVTAAFQDAVIDQPLNPLRGKGEERIVRLDHGHRHYHVYDSEQVRHPGVSAWQPATPGTLETHRRPVFLWITAAAISLVVVLGLWDPYEMLDSGQVESQRVIFLPFESVGDVQGESSQALIKGLGYDLQTELSKLPDIWIASSLATASLDNTERTALDIAREFEANRIIEGSLVHEPGSARIFLRLTNGLDGSLLWAESWALGEQSLGDIRSAVLAGLSTALGGMPAVAEGQQTQSAGDLPQDSYRSYLEAAGYFRLPVSYTHLDAAESRLDQLVRRHPQFVDARALFCQVQIERFEYSKDPEDYAQAQDTCTPLQQMTESGRRSIIEAVARLKRVEGELDRSVELYRLGLAHHPDDAFLMAGLASSLMARGDAGTAQDVLGDALRLEPGNWLLHSRLAALQLSRGEPGAAIQSFERAIDLVPEQASLYNSLGSARMLAGDFAGAAKAYDRSLAINPSHSAFSNNATVHYYQGNYATARDYYLQALELAPEQFAIRTNLADSLRQMDTAPETWQAVYAEALSAIERQLEINREDATLNALAAWCAVNLDRAELAATYLDRALAAAADSAVIYYYAALTQMGLGETRNARASLTRASELGFPDSMIHATPEFSSILGH